MLADLSSCLERQLIPQNMLEAAEELPSWSQYGAATGTAEADVATCNHPCMFLFMNNDRDSHGMCTSTSLDSTIA